jgi:glycine cleavage system T protein (aminomethyltransferase)
MSIALLPTPFHIRTAQYNTGNAWLRRGAFTLPAHFGDPQYEALAARFSCVLADVSALEDMCVEGAGAGALLAAACGPGVRTLKLGGTHSVQWSADGGGLRGFGTLLHVAENEFVLRGSDADIGWFAPHASRFGASIRDATAERGVLLLAGPFAPAVLAAAGLEQVAAFEPDEHVRHDWSGIPVSLSREARLNAYVIACAADVGAHIFDRLLKAGLPLGLRLAGQQAVELLQLEAGIALPHLDFKPARANFALEPLPASLGVSAPAGDMPVLAGVEFDSDGAYPFATLFHEGTEAGRTLCSAYSLALRRAIALAQLDPKYAAPGTALRIPGAKKTDTEAVARVVPLPFLQ